MDSPAGTLLLAAGGLLVLLSYKRLAIKLAVLPWRLFWRLVVRRRR